MLRGLFGLRRGDSAVVPNHGQRPSEWAWPRVPETVISDGHRVGPTNCSVPAPELHRPRGRRLPWNRYLDLQWLC